MANLQIRIDDNLKAEAQKVAHDLGFDLTTAIRVFLKQMINDNALPFVPSRDAPNQVTKQAMMNALNRSDFDNACTLEELPDISGDRLSSHSDLL